MQFCCMATGNLPLTGRLQMNKATYGLMMHTSMNMICFNWVCYSWPACTLAPPCAVCNSHAGTPHDTFIAAMCPAAPCVVDSLSLGEIATQAALS